MNRCANAFRELGVRKGDRVALFMPMCPELIVSFFATIKLGASILPLFSGYGADAAAARVRDAEATVLVTADGFWRRGQAVPMKATADLVAEASLVNSMHGGRAAARHGSAPDQWTRLPLA